MFGLNNAQLIGRLGADATISHLTNGGRVANISIATDESFGPIQEKWRRPTPFALLLPRI